MKAGICQPVEDVLNAAVDYFHTSLEDVGRGSCLPAFGNDTGGTGVAECDQGVGAVEGHVGDGVVDHVAVVVVA
jgi:hypothetical protein